MALTTGSRLGPYEILSPLGAGGMGEVYRARDTRLGRDVAIKVLPEAFATDPDRLARFQREAQLLASLNHPNIAIIHGLEDYPPDVGAGFSRPNYGPGEGGSQHLADYADPELEPRALRAHRRYVHANGLTIRRKSKRRKSASLV